MLSMREMERGVEGRREKNSKTSLINRKDDYPKGVTENPKSALLSFLLLPGSHYI